MQRNIVFLLIAVSLVVPSFSDDHEVYSISAGYPVSFSSVADKKGCGHPRLDAQGKGWCPQTNGTNQWLQVSSVKPQLWTGVITQGASDGSSWVQKYLVSYSLNGEEWTYVDNGRTFEGNIDGSMKVKNVFDKPVVARSIKIHPLKSFWQDVVDAGVIYYLWRVEFIHKHL